jgi:tetratricopeptide (TPR) repeat protein
MEHSKVFTNIILRTTLTMGLFLLATAITSNDAFAQTGSRLSGGSQPVTAIQVNPSNEMKVIANMIRTGNPDKAVRRLKKYLRNLDNINLGIGHKYHGLNALCSAYTSAGKSEDALKTCGKAIRLMPNRWMAFNTRGAAYFVSGNIPMATADYQAALGLVPDNSRFEEIVRGNLALTKSNP